MKSRRALSGVSIDNDEEEKVSPVLLTLQLLNEVIATALLVKLAQIVDLEENQIKENWQYKK